MPLPTRLTVTILVALLLVPAGGAAAQEAPDPPERMAGRLLVRGMTRTFLGDDEGAIALYREALALTPDDASILAALAEAHHRIGDDDSALFFARSAASRDPGRPGGGLLIADLLLATGDTGEALAELDRLSNAFPDDDDVLRSLAEALVRAEQPTRAREAFRTLADRNPGDPVVLGRLLTLETDLGELERALRVLDELEAVEPGDADLAVRRGRLLVQLGRPTEAAEAFEGALVLAPAHREARAALAGLGVDPDSARAAGDAGRSGADWLRAASADPRNRDAWTRAVRSLAREGRTADALRAADDALLLFPGDVRLEVEAGLAALLAVLPGRALAHFEAALRFVEERPGDDEGASQTAGAGRRYAAALGGQDEPSTSDGAMPAADPDALALRALADRDIRRAIDLADAARAADPDGPLAAAALAGALARAGREDEALTLLAPRLESDPVAPLVLMIAGDVLAARGRAEEARSAWQRGLDASPDSPVLRSRLADRR
jgi:tetratricopeptide (TPR) repeat protein